MTRQSISRRGYRSELRQRQAEETRTRILFSAAELFAADGYARTTLAKIASVAGVSPETVQGQGSKAALLIAALEYTVVGVSGEENVLNLELGRRLQAAASPSDAVELIIAEQTEAHERSAGLGLALIGAANGDPELDRYLTALLASVTEQHRRLLAIFRDRGWLRDQMPFDELVETSAVLCSIETFIRITQRDGWTVDRYRTWLRRVMTNIIFVAPQPN
ncbi:TetR/AcrR family transcriptional regulator [Mycobacterium sp. OTB74]|uniref:TetR/AcrR family transcriptional regulator n=1 Tax=Mycobacterium sp. OTB74 TaxID=1853452 RepID=UPI0024770F84|nr:TetR/AcrR family transcriptional regulator [Mycobacterium sp. OTB74]MDH6242628.1 AcrR family transcriptional regulator [Mycobacterium sp. OTB74]